MTWPTIALVAAGWTLASVPLGILVGRIIRHRDTRG